MHPMLKRPWLTQGEKNDTFPNAIASGASNTESKNSANVTSSSGGGGGWRMFVFSGITLWIVQN